MSHDISISPHLGLPPGHPRGSWQDKVDFFVDQLLDSAVVDVCSHVSKNMAPLWMVNLCESLKKRDTMDVKICVFKG